MLLVNETNYDLKLNTGKVKQIEPVLGISFMAELRKNGGMSSFGFLETSFAVALHDIDEDKPVKGKKATDVLNDALSEHGWAEVNAFVMTCIERDLGFLFQ